MADTNPTADSIALEQLKAEAALTTSGKAKEASALSSAYNTGRTQPDATSALTQQSDLLGTNQTDLAKAADRGFRAGQAKAAEPVPAPTVFTSEQANNKDAENQAAYDQADLAMKNGLATENEKPKTTPTTPTTPPLKTTTSEETSGGETGSSLVNKQLQEILDQNEQAYQDYKDKVDKIMNGTMELSSSDQAYLNSIQDQINQAVADQRRTNEAQVAAVTQLGIRAGRNRYAPEVDTGIIGEQITAGTRAIQAIESQGAATLGQARRAIEDKNMELLDKAMTKFTELQNLKSKTIEDMFNNTLKAADEARQNAAAAREQLKADQEAYEKEIQSSREGAIMGLINQGVTDPAEIFNYVNYDESGNQVGDITVKEITDITEALKKAKNDPGTYQVIGGPSEGLYQLTKDASGQVIGMTELIKPRPSASSAHAGDFTIGNTRYDAEGNIIVKGETSNQNGRPLPATQAKTLSEGFQIPLVLKDLDKLLDENNPDNKRDLFGPVAGWRTLNPFDEDAQITDASLRRASQVVGRFMEGGVLREEDEKKYRKMLPQLTDTPEVAKDKLEKVRELLQDKTTQYLDDFEAAGFDVSGFRKRFENNASMAPVEKKKTIWERNNPNTSYEDAVKEYGQDAVDSYLQDQPDFNSVPSTTQNGSIGSLSEKYESGGDPGAIGYDSTGGYSYGTYQLAHNNAKAFIDQSPYAKEFSGLTFNSPEWRSKWKEVAKADPSGFSDAQKNYISETHFVPQVKILASAGIDVKNMSPVLRDVIWSTAVQHGPNNRIVVNAIKRLGPNASEEDIIRAIYNDRWSGGKQFASSTEGVKKGVYNRFFGPNGEMNLALARLSGNMA